jgi:Holliday junction DNA helicase RuvA
VIARLTGNLLESRSDRVVVDVGGVGYELAVPLGTFTALPAVGEKVALHVYTHVREDALLLFGFATSQEKYVFERLLSVSGIGPKVALTVLSGMPLPELVGAIVSQNVPRLSTIPGVGKKIAERLGLELKEKLRHFGLVTTGKSLVPKTTAAEDAVAALQNLGYKIAQAEAAVATAAREVSAENLGALLQAALKSLAR